LEVDATGFVGAGSGLISSSTLIGGAISAFFFFFFFFSPSPFTIVLN
jgi:hypothetical protein